MYEASASSQPAVPNRSLPVLTPESRKGHHATADTTVVLYGDGSFRTFPETARRMLDIDDDDHMPSSFFSLVHPMHLYPVMQGVSAIVCRGKSHVTWLLRLRTGKRLWRWYRVSARPSIGGDEGELYFTLSIRGPIDEFTVGGAMQAQASAAE